MCRLNLDVCYSYNFWFRNLNMLVFKYWKWICKSVLSMKRLFRKYRLVFTSKFYFSLVILLFQVALIIIIIHLNSEQSKSFALVGLACGMLAINLCCLSRTRWSSLLKFCTHCPKGQLHLPKYVVSWLTPGCCFWVHLSCQICNIRNTFSCID